MIDDLSRRVAQSVDATKPVRLTLALIVIAIGIAVVIGWLCDITWIKTLLPGLRTMKVNTALAMVTGGAAVMLMTLERPAANWCAVGFVSLMSITGALTLLEYITGSSLGIDELLVIPSHAISAPLDKRMSPVTATGFVVLGISFSLLARGQSRLPVHLAHGLASLTVAVASLAITGYAYGGEDISGLSPYLQVALHTGIGQLLLAAAALLTRANEGWAAQFVGRPIATAAFVRIVLISALIPFAAGLLAVLGMREGLYQPAFSPALFAVATACALVGLALRSARILARSEDRVRVARDEARRSEEQFRVFANAVPNHIWAARHDGYLDWYNDQVGAYSGETTAKLRGVNAWARIVHPDDLALAAAKWQHCLVTGDIYETEFRIRRADGAYRWFLVRAEPVRNTDSSIVRWVGTNTDIDERRRQALELARLNSSLEAEVEQRTNSLMAAEEQLRQSQKMEAVGQLTGGLAHDFNNLLAGITGSLELLSARIAQGRIAEADRFVIAAQGAAKRAAALTHRLLAFSRRQTLDPKPADANRLIIGMEELIRRTVGPTVQLNVVTAGGLWPILVDPHQLENAILNLCINARDAMPAGGRLTIESANHWFDENAAKEQQLDAGQYISVCVTDTGTGMTADVISKAFDPFFTTKPIGQGTGLGLSMVYGFVRQSGGQVRIYSELEQGTMVCLYLPRLRGETVAIEEPAAPAPAHVGGDGETVLIVDDEPTVRMLVTEVLAELGYAAIEAPDSVAGLKILESNVRIDLLVTDVGLPGGMNGRQMADAARVHRNNLRVLFITGYAANAVVENGHLEQGMHIMTKPFSMQAIAAKIRQLIDEAVD